MGAHLLSVSRARRAGAFMMAIGLMAVAFSLVAPGAGALDHPEHCGDDATTASSHAPGSTSEGNGNSPAGNNGTIKIDGCELDQGRGPDNDKPGNGDPDNEPHIGCLVTVDWYGYDEDSEDDELFSSVLFEVWAPTGGADPVTVPVVGFRAPGNGHDPFDGTTPYDSGDDVYIGEDPASGGNPDGLDASVTYRMDEVLAAFEPHAQHGWHVKLTIEAEGSQGADVKHKVFWTGPCEDTTTTTTSSTTTTLGGTTTTLGGTTTTLGGTTTTLGGTTTTLGGTTTTLGGATTTLGGQFFPDVTTTTQPPAVLGASIETTTTTTTTPAAVQGTTVTTTAELARTDTTSAVLGVQLARTGDETRLLTFLAGLVFLLGGAALVTGEKVAHSRTAA